MKNKAFLFVILLACGFWSACSQGADSPEELARILIDAIDARDVRSTKAYVATVEDIAELGKQAGKSSAEIEAGMAELRADPDRLERNWGESFLQLIHELDKSTSKVLPSTPQIKVKEGGELARAFIRIAFKVDNGIVTVETVGLRNGKWRFLPPMGYESETIGRR